MEPYAVTRARAFKQIRACISPAVAWRGCRIIVITALAAGVLGGLCLLWMPLAQLPWGRMLGVVVTMPPVLGLIAIGGVLCPVYVDVSRERLVISQGSGGRHIDRAQLRSLSIERDGNWMWLHVHYSVPPNAPRLPLCSCVAIADKVDLSALEALVTDHRQHVDENGDPDFQRST